MRFAVGIPNLGDYADPRVLADLAELAEESGWDAVFCWDHLSRLGEPATDPQVALAAMALATERVLLGAMVTPLARRRPAKVARETVALDHLSGGRLIVGVGLGSRDEEEFASFGDSPDRVVRGQQLDEALDVLTALWTGEPVAHDGPHYRAHTAAGFRPTPVQQPRIPIWVAGTWPAKPAFRRAARFDGLFPTFRGVSAPDNVDPAQLAEAVAYALAHREPACRRWRSPSRAPHLRQSRSTPTPRPGSRGGSRRSAGSAGLPRRCAHGSPPDLLRADPRQVLAPAPEAGDPEVMSTSSTGSTDHPENPYAVTLDELEHDVRVPAREQVTEQSVDRPTEGDSTWDEAQRQLRLAGGA